MRRVKDVARYARQIILPEIGPAGQEKLSRATVLMVGVGGLGSPAAYYLAAAGVGRLILVDADRVDISNLHRQILHFTDDLKRPKVVSAQEKLLRINPRIKVQAVQKRFAPINSASLLKGVDLVLDGSDNFETRYAVNAACVKRRIPLVWGAVSRWEGQAMVIVPGKTACYACAFPEPPAPELAQSCSEAGILGPTGGVVGSIMASEAIKCLVGLPSSLEGGLLSLNTLTFRFRVRPVARSLSARKVACGCLTAAIKNR